MSSVLWYAGRTHARFKGKGFPGFGLRRTSCAIIFMRGTNVLSWILRRIALYSSLPLWMALGRASRRGSVSRPSPLRFGKQSLGLAEYGFVIMSGLAEGCAEPWFAQALVCHNISLFLQLWHPRKFRAHLCIPRHLEPPRRPQSDASRSAS